MRSLIFALALFPAVCFSQAVPVPTPVAATVIPFPGTGAVAATASTTGGVTLASGATVAFAALTAGMVVGYYTVDYLFGGDQEQMRVPVGPQTFMQPQPPDAPPNAEWEHVVSFFNPNYSSECNSQLGSMMGVHPCSGASCENPCSLIGATYENGWCMKQVPAGTCGIGYAFTVGVKWTQANSCPRGYSNNGGSCFLANSRVVTNDKKCDVSYNGAYSTSDDLNCSATYGDGRLTPLIRNGNVVAYGTNSSGQPLLFEVSSSNGVTTISQSSQSTVNGQSQVNTQTAQVNTNTGQVISTSGSVSPGTISAPSGSGSSVPTTNTAPNPTNTPTVSNPSGQTQVVQTINFPSDYARAGEAQNAANSIKNDLNPRLDQLHKDLTEAAQSPDSPFFDKDLSDVFFKDTFKGMLNWQLPSHSSQCPVSTFTAFGLNYQIDTHCKLVTDHFNAISSVMIAVWFCLSLFILLRA